MTDLGPAGLVLILVNILFSYMGLTNNTFLESYKFDVNRILVNKDYKRLLTSGFLHVSWGHLILNMISLYFFSGLLELQLGTVYFCVVYFASLIGGNLLALFIHRAHGDYTAVGASGAISGIIFASIALFPGLGIGFFGIPISIPSWLYGILYIFYTIYGIKSKKDDIGHEAHLGGALIGMVTAILIHPVALKANYLPILLITIPTIAFIYLIITRPQILVLDYLFFGSHRKHYNIDHKFNEEKQNKQAELDRLLDKINRNGINSLSKREKEKLAEYSK